MRRCAIDMQALFERWRAAANALDRPVTFMEVCGTHTMSVFRSGLRSLQPPGVTLLSGPGCPVCVTDQDDIDAMIAIAARRVATLFTYGDMLRVPGRRGSLQEARSEGADVRVAYSALDAVRFAERHPDRRVCLAAIGFETTAPATAAAVLEARRRGLRNFLVFSSHKRIEPALLALLADGRVKIDGLLCPGHVAVITGLQPFRPLVDRHRLPCVVAGFEDAQIVEALVCLTEMALTGNCRLVNAYPEAVSDEGNRTARRLLEVVFRPATARWRGLGAIPESGLCLRDEFRAFDACACSGVNLSNREEAVHPAGLDEWDPAGCLCGRVITGRATPRDCRHFARDCTPVHPIGPCMVSSEGTCQAWFKYRRDDMRAIGRDRLEREPVS